MKKVILAIVALFIIIFLAVSAARLFTGEDTWICKDGQWIKHGNPKSSMPTKPCQKEGEEVSGETGENTNLPNPASVNCTQKGGKLEIRQETAGEYGVCKFSDGTECEEWQFFRNECQKGQYKVADTSHPYSGFINKIKTDYFFKDGMGNVYSLKLSSGAGKELRERLDSEVGRKEAVTIIASETPPLSKVLFLRGFQEK